MATWACGSCGGENPEGMSFCGHCGAPADSPWRCADCGGENLPATRFCGHRGAARSEVAQAPQEPERDVADALRSFVAEQVADVLIEAGDKLPEERRLITALFADVSGFTTPADRLDPEELLEVIDPVISGLSSVVGRYGGYVEKFAGDALMALFGAPVSHEDDAARALLVALEMHTELARLVQKLPHDAELTLHVGVNSGHGIARILGSEARMDYAVLGDSVILAQRLESAAPPGETYLSETTARLTEGKFELEPVGELVLKGKAEPVWAWRLVGESQSEALRGPTTLVGRERELAELHGALVALQDRRGGLVRLTGEPGVGKSHLVEAAHERARQLGIRWVSARCLSYGEGLAYWPYAGLVRDLEGAAVSPYFAALLGLDGDQEVEALQPEAFRRGLHDAFAAWLQDLGAEQPTLLVLEDVHWADASSLALTRELAVALHGGSVAIVLTGRPEAEAALAELTEGIASQRLTLGALDDEAISSLATFVLEGTPPAELVRFVAERTAGNPFFVKELLRALLDSQGLVRDRGRWRMRSGWDARELPPTIEGVLAARIDLLPRSAAATLATASVIGRRVPQPLLRAVAGDGGLTESLNVLVSAGLLERAPDDGVDLYSFHHALVQDVAYSRLLRRHRRDLHRRVAEVAEALYGAGDDVIDLLARQLSL